MSNYQYTLDPEFIGGVDYLVPEGEETKKSSMGVFETGRKAFLVDGITGSALMNVLPYIDAGGEDDPNWSPTDDDMVGFEGYRDNLLLSSSKKEFDLKKGYILLRHQYKQEIAEGGNGFGQFCAASMDLPMYLFPMGLTASTLSKVGGSVLKGAIGTIARNTIGIAGASTVAGVAFETGMHILDDERTLGESANSISTFAITGGIFGLGLGAFAARRGAKIARINKYLARGLEIPAEHKVPDYEKAMVTAADLARNQQTYGKTMRIKVQETFGADALRQSPGLRMDASFLDSARKHRGIIADTPYAYEHNAAGIANVTSMESITNKLYSVEMNDTIKELTKAFKASTGETVIEGLKRRALGGSKEWDAFNKQVGEAMLRHGKSIDPHVEKVAKQLISRNERVFNEGLKVDILGLKRHAVETIEKQISDVEKRLRQQSSDIPVDSIEGLKKRWAESKTSRESSKKAITEKDFIAENRRDFLAKNKEKLQKANERELIELKAKLEFEKKKVWTTKDLPERPGGEGYIHILHDIPKINAESMKWESMASEYYKEVRGLTHSEAMDAAFDARESIVSTPAGRLSKSHMIAKRGPLKGKTLDIPAEYLGDFIIKNADVFQDKFYKTVLVDTEVMRMYGDLTGSSAIAEMENEARSLMKGAKTDADRSFIQKELKTAIEDFQGILGRLRGQTNLNGSNIIRSEFLHAAINTAKNISSMRLLGKMLLTASGDIGQSVMTLGAKNYFGSSLKLMMNPKIAKEAYEMETWLRACEVYSGSRMTSILEAASTTAGIGTVERVSKSLSNFTFRMTGIHTWDDMTKFLAGYAGSERILKTIIRHSKGKKLSKVDRDWMNQVGISKSHYQLILEQFNAHGSKKRGIYQPAVHKWDNIAAQRNFGGAIQKLQSQAVITPGISDAPFLFDNKWGGLFLQFKRFGFAAYEKSLIPALQKRDSTVFTGILTMLSVGVLAASAKAALSGRTLTADQLMEQAITRSDIVAHLPDMYDVLDSMFGFNEENNKYRRSLASTLSGPFGGLVTDISKAGSGAYAAAFRNGMTRTQLRAMRRLIPLQNHIIAGSIFDLVEDSVAKAFNITNKKRKILRGNSITLQKY